MVGSIRLSPHSRLRRQYGVIHNVTARAVNIADNQTIETHIVCNSRPVRTLVSESGRGPWVTLRSPTAKSRRLTPPGSRLSDDKAGRSLL